MQIDAMTMGCARRALRTATGHHLYDPNVTLIDFGRPRHGGRLARDELAIRVHVRRKLAGLALESALMRGTTAASIPRAIEGFQTDVIEAAYRPHLWPWSLAWKPTQTSARTARADPLHGGISISDEYHNAYATLGGLVADRASGAEMILSNWHVLVASWRARAGQRIVQPGRLDGGSTADAVAALTRDAMAANLDAAVATLTGRRELINDQLQLGPVRGVSSAELDIRTVKSGRRTAVTYGTVVGVEGEAKLTYSGVQRVIRRVVTIEPVIAGNEISAGGDSGSWWLATASRQVIGLHFAGSNAPETALAMDMPAVLHALNVAVIV
jgi:endonuclease G